MDLYIKIEIFIYKESYLLFCHDPQKFKNNPIYKW